MVILVWPMVVVLDNIHVFAIELEETVSDIVIDDFVHCLPYVMKSCFALYGQGSHLCHCIRIWILTLLLGDVTQRLYLLTLGFAVGEGL